MRSLRNGFLFGAVFSQSKLSLRALNIHCVEKMTNPNYKLMVLKIEVPVYYEVQLVILGGVSRGTLLECLKLCYKL